MASNNKTGKAVEKLKETEADTPQLHKGTVTSPSAGLSDVRSITNEMKRVYYLVFKGEIMLSEATRLCYLLTQMINAMKVEAEMAQLQSAYSKAWAGVHILTNEEIKDAEEA